MSKWIYSQSTGKLSCENGVLFSPPGLPLFDCYSGHGDGLNNPTKQFVKSVGPIPKGLYLMGWAVTHPQLGPMSIQLTPHPNNVMGGREDFWIHGDNLDRNMSASKGCIVTGLGVRQTVNNSAFRVLKVVD